VFADVADLHPSGAGTTTTFRTQRGDAKDALDLVSREQRHLDLPRLRVHWVEPQIVVQVGFME
jgi:hypothetical protein